MFSVERMIGEESIVDTMEAMRTWLDHKHYEPATFRYTFTSGGVVFRVDFSNETAAADFATGVSGQAAAAGSRGGDLKPPDRDRLGSSLGR
jgi:hypothetical protein